MLQAIVSIASGLHRVRALIWILGLASVLGLLAAIVFEDSGNRYSRLALVGLAWSGFLLALTHFFADRDWTPPGRRAPFWQRVGWRLRLALAWLVVGCLAVVAVMLGVLSLRAFTV